MQLGQFLFASVSAAFLVAGVAATGGAENLSSTSAAKSAEAGYRDLAAGQLTAAISGFSTAIESRQLAPEALAHALLNRALAYQQSARHEEAIGDYTAALRLDAMSAKLRAMALYNRGLAQQKVQSPALAIEDFTSALFLDASLSHAYYGRGNVLRDNGQYLFALSDYEKALHYKYSDVARVHYGEALAYEGLKRPDRMAKALRAALAANPQFEPARLKLEALGPAESEERADPMAIGSISQTQLTIRKEVLAKPVAPSAELAQVEAPTFKNKMITDRIPSEESEPDSAEIEERIIAIERLPEAEERQVGENPWSVQVASTDSEEGAWAVWQKMQSRHALLADVKAVVVRADLGTKGIFYRVRLGYPGKRAASDACMKLKARGLACFVSKLHS